MRHPFVAVALAAAALRLACLPASGHDNYTGLQPDGSFASTSPCCGDQDCEGIEWSGVDVHPDGSVSLFSPRWSRSVLIAAEHVTWVGLPPRPDGTVFPAHWCGVKRTGQYTPHEGGEPTPSPPTADQPDPMFFTYCAFIAPGGA